MYNEKITFTVNHAHVYLKEIHKIYNHALIYEHTATL